MAKAEFPPHPRSLSGSSRRSFAATLFTECVARLWRLIPRDADKIAARHEAEIRAHWTSEDVDAAHRLDESDPEVQEALGEIRAAGVKKAERASAIQAENE